MLVLSRKKDESIVINDDITIVVVEIRGDKVRLGIEAPKEVPVHRREVFEAIVDVSPPTSEPCAAAVDDSIGIQPAAAVAAALSDARPQHAVVTSSHEVLQPAKQLPKTSDGTPTAEPTRISSPR